MLAGIGLVILAAFFQGIFLSPMSRMRHWNWEHTWLAFSVFAMLACNWALAFLSLPSAAKIYSSVQPRELMILASIGLAWGIGAVLFGIGMDLLGLALGYPLIMGLNASLGTFIPLAFVYGGSMFVGRRFLISIGTLIAVIGIAICSFAGMRRKPDAVGAHDNFHTRFFSGLAIAVASGCLSCLPNIGLAYGTSVVHSARLAGASEVSAGNAVWLILFSFGGLVNVVYCCWLIFRRRNHNLLFSTGTTANWGWAWGMGMMWIGSFYLYGLGASKMGAAGSTVGWPILVSLSIGTGVLCGLGKGEWRGASPASKSLLWMGLALIILAVVIIPVGTTSH